VVSQKQNPPVPGCLPLRTARATVVAELHNTTTRQPIELGSFSDPLSWVGFVAYFIFVIWYIVFVETCFIVSMFVCYSHTCTSSLFAALIIAQG